MNNAQTALLLIDLQKESKYDLINLENVISNCRKLISHAREINIPIIYTRQINRHDCIGLSYRELLDTQGEPVFYNSSTENIEIIDEIKPHANDIIIDKYRWSAFFETSLDLMLKSLEIKNLIIGGLVTDGCLMTTVFDAYFRDYQINLVRDICSTSNAGAHMSSILIMCNWIYGIEVLDTMEMINKMKGKNYKSWKWSRADELKFNENNLKDVFAKLCP